MIAIYYTGRYIESSCLIRKNGSKYATGALAAACVLLIFPLSLIHEDHAKGVYICDKVTTTYTYLLHTYFVSPK